MSHHSQLLVTLALASIFFRTFPDAPRVPCSNRTIRRVTPWTHATVKSLSHPVQRPRAISHGVDVSRRGLGHGFWCECSLVEFSRLLAPGGPRFRARTNAYLSALDTRGARRPSRSSRGQAKLPMRGCGLCLAMSPAQSIQRRLRNNRTPPEAHFILKLGPDCCASVFMRR